ncbi:MAG: cupin domain-containing protein [Alphaproteobacteria bacterium]|nr:cupin domain-containing protein [Alphaproteobacteria bacterium]
MKTKVSIADKHTLFNERWSPKIIAGLDNYDVKIAKVEGEFVWHQHDEEDEFFLVTRGRLKLELEGRDAVTLDEGEIYVVPAGLRHKPVALPYAEIMMIERKGVVNTGDAGHERAVAAEEL